MIAEPSQASLKKRLTSIISEMERSAKTAQMVSINASIIAVQSRAEQNEAYAFEAVAEQILSISQESVGRIATLREIVAETHDLTATINIAGRQRMISQRYMKLSLLDALLPDDMDDLTRAGEREALRRTFEEVLEKLLRSRLNTPEISRMLERVKSTWNAFIHEMNTGQLAAAAKLNEQALTEMNATVDLYEELA